MPEIVRLIDVSRDRRLDETWPAQGDVATIAAPQQSQILAARGQESVGPVGKVQFRMADASSDSDFAERVTVGPPSSGKKRTPTVAIIDSQSARTAEGGEERGYDAGKKITGRKRHLAVDTLGLVWMAVVHGAEWQDQDGACVVLMRLREQCRRLKVIFADCVYPIMLQRYTRAKLMRIGELRSNRMVVSSHA